MLQEKELEWEGKEISTMFELEDLMSMKKKKMQWYRKLSQWPDPRRQIDRRL